MTQSFLTKLDAAVDQNKSLVCVGIDPDPTLMPVPADEVGGRFDDGAAEVNDLIGRHGHEGRVGVEANADEALVLVNGGVKFGEEGLCH